MKNLNLLRNTFGTAAKRLTYNSTLLLLILSLYACEDNLMEEPKSVTAENFYNTPEEVEAGVNAIYNPMRFNRAEYIAVLDAHTDWGYGRGSRANYNDFEGFNSGNINVSTGRWNAFYESIRNANLVIQNAPDGTSISQEEVDGFVAEAKFLRALAYFDLVRNWGGVPLRTEENMTDINVSKSTADEVYELILSDLMEAENDLPEEPGNIGRPTTYAAKTLLADVYLTLERFEEASQKAKEVMDSNRFALVPASSIEDLQWNLFGPEILTSTEEIFSFKYMRHPGQGNFMLWILNHPSTSLFNFGGAYAHYSDSANTFYTNWDDADLRKALWDQIDFGLGSTTLVSKKYIDPSAVSQNGAGNDLPIYRYAEVLLIYAEAASRVAGGPTPETMEALNQVHRRAYGQNPSSPSSVDFSIEDYDAETFLDLVLQENAYEFQFEGKRWLDLKRTGRAAEAIMDVKGISIAEKHYLWPIPPEELSFNEAMSVEDQNPGY
ncbi:RagB/SusD family nutrient uptake outer membrane protein [Catalinimonas niigatensis]|uniref:RagB/SusD family nutrient uptake outer membrane protein n=1 Tax=Catalinimonas niigatensis TaxID=1397264 RepID=UPI002666E95C|nr:RagB/SusD family nutrient uptake outer membrane protein [Catalinimonas niigatensis]WPP48018.1 RagB/SusD family nutrient uptake outer membrane protein [Catalinimonas niigatensis]